MKRSFLLLLVLPVLARACYNDRDTLGFELRDRPDAQRALTGRFERNPPLYYRMRVARLRAKPRLTPAEDDDLAVALDRLGRSEEGLAALSPVGRTTADDRYRFFANRGTLRAHRWLRRGGKRTEVHELRVAEGDIARALKINPNAHFGREATQLEVIRWLDRSRGKADEDDTLGWWLSERVRIVDPIRGLEGLIMLGGAWESPDSAYAIAELASHKDEFATTELAFSRYQELRAHSGHPLKASEKDEASMELHVGLTPPEGEPPVAQSFRRLRDEAEAWNARRSAFMLARLRAGRHPDTDASFWSGWRDTPMPTLDPAKGPTSVQVGMRRPIALVIDLLAGVFVVAGFFILWLVRGRARRA